MQQVRYQHASLLPFQSVSSGPLYAVRLVDVPPGVYMSWREAQPQTVGIHILTLLDSRPNRKQWTTWP